MLSRKVTERGNTVREERRKTKVDARKLLVGWGVQRSFQFIDTFSFSKVDCGPAVVATHL